MTPLRRLGLTLAALVLALVPLHAQTFETSGLTINIDPSESARVWQDAGMSTPAGDGQLVRALDDAGDATGNAMFAVNDSARPTYRATGLNGLGAIEYPGGATAVYLLAKDDGNTTNRTLGDFIDNTDYTYFIAFNMDGAFNNANVYDNPGLISDAQTIFGLATKNTAGQRKLIAWHWDAVAYRQTSAFDVDASTNYVARVRFDGSTIRFAVFGAANPSPTELTVSAGNVGGVGSLFVQGNYWLLNAAYDGLIGQMLFYDVHLTGASLDDTTDYMVNKWVNSGGSGGGPTTVPSLGPFIGGPFVAWSTPTLPHARRVMVH